MVICLEIKTIDILSILGNNVDQEEYQSYKDSFDAFDWNNSGREGFGVYQSYRLLVYCILYIV